MSIKFLTFSILLIGAFRSSHLQVPKLGKCPKGITPVGNFKSSDFAGLWYEIKRYPSVVILGQCATLMFTSDANAKTVKITAAHVIPGAKVNSTQTIEASDNGNGSFNYKMTIGMVSGNATITVIDTDYKNYAVIFSCVGLMNFSNLQNVWIISRSQNMTQSDLDKALSALKKQKIDTLPLIVPDLSSCM